METKLIKISEAAKILGVSKLTLRNWDKSGKLVAFRHPINNYRVYRSEDIKNIIKQIESGEKIIKPTKKKLSTTKNEISKNIENISEIKIPDLNNNIPMVTNSAMPEFVTNPNISQNNSEMKN
jgi:DNA-binding transcriptional MerR regulator